MRRLLLIALGTIWPTAAGWAQVATTGALQGRIREPDDRPLALTTIEISQPSRAVLRRLTTDSAGRFRAGFLPPGEYRIAARRIGYRPAVVDRVVIESGSVTTVTVTLAPVALNLDALEVAAPAVAIEPERPEFGTRIGAKELARLPLPDQARDLVKYAIGARPDQVWGGATAQANNYQLDGVAVNHPGTGGDLLQPPVSWIEEVQVKGLGSGSELGNFQGGVVNLVTKSGSNRLEGGLRALGESRRLNGSNLIVGEAGSEPAGRAEVDGQLRGPLVRDRLFFAAFGQIVSRDQRVLNQVPEIPASFVPDPPRTTERRFLGKLDWRPSDRDAVTASVARFEATTDRFGQNGFKTTDATQTEHAGTWLGSFGWQRTLSSRSFVELKLSALDGSDRREPRAGAGVPGIQLLNEVDPREYQNAVFGERREPRNLAATVAWDWFATVGGLDHHVRIGGEIGAARWRSFRDRNGGMTWRPGFRDQPPAFDPALPSTWLFNGVVTSTWGGTVALDAKVRNHAAWIQDYVRLTPRLTLSAGLRMGVWQGDLQGTAGAFLPVVRTSAAEPRIGLSWSLTKDTDLAVKAHWGIYHQSLFAGFFDRAAGTRVYEDEVRWATSTVPVTDPRTPLTPGDLDRLARLGVATRVATVRQSETGAVSGFRQPSVSQAVLGLEKTWAGRWKAEAVYVRRRNRDMAALVDRNLATNYTWYYNVTALDRFGRPFFLNGRPLVIRQIALSNEDILKYWALVKAGILLGPYTPPGLTGAQLEALQYRPDYALTTAPDAFRRFDQLQLRLETRHERWWLDLGAAFTRLDGNLNSVSGPDDDGSSAGPYVHANEAYQAYGRLANQARLEIKARLGGDLPRGFRGSVFAYRTSGDHYTPTLTLSNLLFQFATAGPMGGPADTLLRSFFFETTTGQRMFLEPRGTYTYPAQLTVDLHLERSIRARPAVVLLFDAFNVLGAAAITEVQTSYNGETDPFAVGRLNAVRARQTPRLLRLGADVRF